MERCISLYENKLFKASNQVFKQAGQTHTNPYCRCYKYAMSAVKERILGAVTVMNENDAQILWNLIIQTFGTNWENIEEVSPDDWDLKMLQEIKTNPECQ